MQLKFNENTQSSEKAIPAEKAAPAIKSVINRTISTKQYIIERIYLNKIPLESIIADEISHKIRELQQ